MSKCKLGLFIQQLTKKTLWNQSSIHIATSESTSLSVTPVVFRLITNWSATRQLPSLCKDNFDIRKWQTTEAFGVFEYMHLPYDWIWLHLFEWRASIATQGLPNWRKSFCLPIVCHIVQPVCIFARKHCFVHITIQACRTFFFYFLSMHKLDAHTIETWHEIARQPQTSPVGIRFNFRNIAHDERNELCTQTVISRVHKTTLPDTSFKPNTHLLGPRQFVPDKSLISVRQYVLGHMLI